MGVHELQKFIEMHCPNACVPVDLLKIAHSVGIRRPVGRNRGPLQTQLCLVVDGECCLDRLYGGYFSDWVCGGQWNRMVQFLAVLVQTVQTNNIELAVFFNGSLELERMSEWVHQQYSLRRSISQVLKHITTKGTPPPKVWWVPPTSLRTCLRMALRHLNVQVLSSMDDHHQEVIAFCRDNNYHGLMAEDAEYIIFDPPRYFSASQLKLTYKGSLETKEFILNEVAKGMDLQSNRFCVLAALLGNYFLNDEDLVPFYRTLTPEHPHGKIPSDVLIKAVVQFVRDLPSVEDLDQVGRNVFGMPSDSRIQKFKQSVQYFINGTKDGYLMYKPSFHSQNAKSSNSVKFASEMEENERDTLKAYKKATGGSGITPQIVVQQPAVSQLNQDLEKLSLTDQDMNGGTPSPNEVTTNGGVWNPQSNRTIKSVSESPKVNFTPPSLPQVPPEVTRTASERHQKGLMSPWIYQILTQGEIKLCVVMEDEMNKEVPNAVELFRSARQMVYAILFNLHHHIYMNNKMKDKSEGEQLDIPEVKVREWMYSRNNPYRQAEEVEAVPVDWGVPTVQRLWFGSTLDDKKRRLRAFLSCLRSDSPLMLNMGHVPQHMLIMACVLRYIMSFPGVLRKQELDAFICQAYSPELVNAQYLQDLQLHLVTSRGAQLAALFMEGVETALFANDACGAPIPWLMCCPWLFFDGKLFHSKLLKANQARNLVDLCDGQIDVVAKVEHMRLAVLEGLNVEFARPSMSSMTDQQRRDFILGGSRPGSHMDVLPAGHGSLMGPGRSHVGSRRTMIARGGQLEIGGVVVGSWAANYGAASRGRGLYMSPTHMSPGGPRNYRYPPNNSGSIGRGSMNVSYQTKPARPQKSTKKLVQKKKVLKKKDEEDHENKGRGMTVETPRGTKSVPVGEILRDGSGDGTVEEEEDQFEDVEGGEAVLANGLE